jgi:hypothetical protein
VKCGGTVQVAKEGHADRLDAGAQTARTEAQ